MCLQNQCPQCGYQPPVGELPNNLLSTLESTPELDSEADMINRKAQQLKLEMERLSQERTNLLRKLNGVQSSTRIFPVEILATIFSHAHSLTSTLDSTSRANSHFQVVLGAVSSHWRQVAWSTPTLWTTVALHVRPSTVRHDARLLSLYLRNSSVHPIQLELVFSLNHMLNPKRPLEQLKPLGDLLFSIHLDKVRSLKLDGMPFQWMSLLSDQFSRIKSLLLGWWPGQKLGPASHPREVTLRGFSELREVTIKRVMPQIVLPWDQLTTLTCHKLPIDICLHLLTLCPSLVKYRNHYSIAPTTSTPLHFDNILHANKHITLKHLSHLEWYHYPSNICRKLQFLEFPALRALLWADSGKSWTSLSALRDLLQHTPGITSLTLTGNGGSTLTEEPSKWRDILATRMPHLTILRLISAPFSFLEVLDPTSILNYGGTLNASDLVVFPRLETLDLDFRSGGFYTDFARLDDSPLVRMLENRRGASQSFAEVCITIQQKVEWSEGVRGRLLKLVRDGLRIIIIEKGIDCSQFPWENAKGANGP